MYVAVGPTTAVSLTSLPHTSRKHLGDKTVETAAKKTRDVMLDKSNPRPGEHQSEQSVKTDIELVGMLRTAAHSQ